MMIETGLILHRIETDGGLCESSNETLGSLKAISPSRSTLDRYMGHTDCDVGISKLVKDRLKAECETLQPTEKIVSVIVEEMAIKERYIYDRTTDKFIGAVNIDGLYDSSIGKYPMLASKLICFVVNVSPCKYNNDLEDRILGQFIIGLNKGPVKGRLFEEDCLQLSLEKAIGLRIASAFQYDLSTSKTLIQVKEEHIGYVQKLGSAVFPLRYSVGGKDLQELECRLTEVLRRLEEAGLTVSERKCKISRESLNVLGFKIDANGIHTRDEKIKAVRDAPRPTCVQELQSFLGIQNTVQLTFPLLSLLGKQIRCRLDLLRPTTNSNKVQQAQEKQIQKYGGINRPWQVGEKVWVKDYRKKEGSWIAGITEQVLGPRRFRVAIPSLQSRCIRHVNQLSKRSNVPVAWGNSIFDRRGSEDENKESLEIKEADKIDCSGDNNTELRIEHNDNIECVCNSRVLDGIRARREIKPPKRLIEEM
ncbi:hypothetical protein ANN_17632 [Periplaneta americana]|uniref:Transposable element P transposase-like RNase H domain-containing protein n=1 Tax=Periplaneta americana TaxID=6978 RepID=A0ABQ8STG3_PERAM|nr:hypothetical protein ANN_17632 [Periplaneta americana]